MRMAGAGVVRIQGWQLARLDIGMLSFSESERVCSPAVYSSAVQDYFLAHWYAPQEYAKRKI